MDRESPSENSQSRSGPGFARREFLKGTGAAVAATALATGAAEAQEKKKPAKIVAGPQKITLNVNGQAKEITVEPRVTLMDALRVDLNLTGCKDVCDRSSCGACTVLIDGKPVLSCTR